LQDVFWPGMVAMFALYALVFLVGVVASRRAPTGSRGSLDELMLAGRALPLWVGLLTMTATWVGGGYINGTAESTYASGVLWGSQAGIGYALSLLLGGIFYARTMRDHRYATLVDPLESRFGRKSAAVLMLPAVLAELFWSAAILVALGSTFGAVMGMDLRLSILISAAVAIGYTVLGGLRAVAYTDVFQLFLILVGLGIAVPFVVSSAGGSAHLLERVTGALGGDTAFGGFSGPHETLSYLDWSVILIGIPWNVYFQRVLAASDGKAAARQSMYAAFLCAFMAVPPLVLGLSGRALDWAVLADSPAGLSLGGAEQVMSDLADSPALILPYLMRLAVPTWVGVLGLGAVAAAVMSSVDSSILSASSLVAWNGYRRLFRPEASTREVSILVRVLVVVLGTAATVIALTVGSVSALWYLCGDVVYCVLFPQLTLALFDRKANTSGAMAGFAVSVFIRLGGGDATLGLPAFLPFPDWGDWEFPFRTVAMVAGLLTALVVSRLTARRDPARPLGPLSEGT
jgi:high affinity choline transporter 7